MDKLRTARSIVIGLTAVSMLAAVSSITPLIGGKLIQKADERLINAINDVNQKSTENTRLIGEIIAKTESMISKIENIPDNSKEKLLLLQFEDDIKSMRERFSVVENIIRSEPEKSLSLIVLRKDIDFQSKIVDQKLFEQNQNIDRLYSILGWSIGGLFVAVMAQAIGGIFVRQSRAASARDD